MNATAIRKRMRVTLTLSLLGVFLGSGLAQAATISVYGSKAWNSGIHLAVKDTATDGLNAYANWNSNGNNRIETSGGNGSTADVYVNPLNNFRACRNIPASPDVCSDWVSP